MASNYQAYGAPQDHVNDLNGYLHPPNASPSYGHNPTPSYNNVKAAENARVLARTPSPTPSEQKELKSGVLEWRTLSQWRFWIRREWLWYYIALIVILVVTALVTIYHKQIVGWLTPVTLWLHDLKLGWLVPIGVLFVISFPPLFGHEIVAILCGLVWGLWIGFAIVSAGTFLGEVGNFYAFKYCCRARGEKLERTKISYACLAKVVRDGGFKIALIARLSAIPGHFTTAVFSTCGMGIIVFSIAAILSLPKQFITVYLGVILEQSNTGVSDTKSKIISDVVLAVTFIITILAMWYIFHQMNKVKPQIIYERRKARQAKLGRAGFSPYSNSFSSESTVTFSATDSDVIPLTGRTDATPYQQWDKNGRAIGYAPNPNNVYNPTPRQASQVPAFRTDGGEGYGANRYSRDEEEYGHDYAGGHGLGIPLGRESTDDVGWDVAPTQNANPEHMYGPPFSSAETLQQDAQQGPLAGPSHQDTRPAANLQTQTSTQGQVVTWNPPASRSDDPPGRLPTPSYHSPFDRPPGAAPAASSYPIHGQEPTDTSYSTALSSSREPSSDDGLDPVPGPPARAFSPPPPSYRTNLR